MLRTHVCQNIARKRWKLMVDSQVVGAVFADIVCTDMLNLSPFEEMGDGENVLAYRHCPACALLCYGANVLTA